MFSNALQQNMQILYVYILSTNSKVVGDVVTISPHSVESWPEVFKWMSSPSHFILSEICVMFCLNPLICYQTWTPAVSLAVCWEKNLLSEGRQLN